MHICRAREPAGERSSVDVDRSPDAIGAHLEDAAHFPDGHADGIARPRSEAEVAELLRLATHVLPIGAQSSVTGGATPAGGLVISSGRLTAIHESGHTHFRVGAGVALETLQNLLTARGRWYAPVPTFTGAFVGGVVSTNAAGAGTFKYGATRAWVDGLIVVLPCGHVIDLARGEVQADPRDGFEIVCGHGRRRFQPGTYRPPAVAKCSAGYFAAPDMDLIDLFIGAEGTLGVIVEATVRVLPAPPAIAMALVPVRSERDGLALVNELRRASQATWQSRDPSGIDIAAIESLDRRCLEVLRQDGVDKAHGVGWPDETDLLLIVQIELPAGTTAATAFDEIQDALAPSAPNTPLTRFCQLLQRHGVFETAELAMPGDLRRLRQLLAIRESAPAGVNRRVGDAKRRDPRIDKTAADMIVPFDRFGDILAIYRHGYERRGLDYAVWGHISDGNVHPNVIPRDYADVEAGREAILEFGREAVRLGGCPLAEHGVGRSPLKQALLRQLYGDEGIEEMRAIKRAIDPEWKLAPGVLFSRA